MATTTKILSLAEIKQSIPLTEVAAKIGLAEPSLAKLDDVDVTTVAEFQEIILVNAAAVANLLGLPMKEVCAFADRLANLAPTEYSLEESDELEELDCTLGALDEADLASDGLEEEEFEFATSANYESLGFSKVPEQAVGFWDHMPSIKNQGKRPTCVAFTVAKCFEFVLKKELSPHFIYWNCKEIDGYQLLRGTSIAAAVRSLKDLHGSTTEALCSYEPLAADPSKRGNKPTEVAYADAMNRKILKGIRLQANDPESIQRAISNGHPVALSIPVFNGWKNNKQVRKSGVLHGRLGEHDPREGHHAITIIGYVKETDDKKSYFVFDNSWGTGWAKENHFGPGRGIFTFDYLKKYCVDREAFVLQVQ